MRKSKYTYFTTDYKISKTDEGVYTLSEVKSEIEYGTFKTLNTQISVIKESKSKSVVENAYYYILGNNMGIVPF